jgi:hypothetical protein
MRCIQGWRGRGYKLMEHIKIYFNNLISNSPLITIPIVTCFGYLFAYQYEVGSAKYYNISEYLVQLELLQVIFNAVVISKYHFHLKSAIKSEHGA